MRISDWSSDVCSSDLHQVEDGQTQSRQEQGIVSDLCVVTGISQEDNGTHPKGQDAEHQRLDRGHEIGSASGRERMCHYVKISVVAVSLKTKTIKYLP